MEYQGLGFGVSVFRVTGRVRLKPRPYALNPTHTPRLDGMHRSLVRACSSRAEGQAAVMSRLCTLRLQPTASCCVWKAHCQPSPALLTSYLQA